TADGQFVAVGALEPAFYAELLERLGLTDDPDLPDRADPANWPALRERFATVFAKRTRAEWAAEFATSDACVAPVLGLDEVAAHPHNQARQSFTDLDGVTQPAPAPRFSRTAPGTPLPPPLAGADTDAVLAGLGHTAADIAGLRARGITGHAG